MRRYLRPLALLALCLLAVMGFMWIVRTVASSTASGRLAQKLADLREVGEPIQLADLARTPIPPENNAAYYLGQAKSDVEAISKQLLTIYESDQETEQIERGHPSESALTLIRSAWDDHPNAIALLERAAACTDYDPQLDTTIGTQAFMDALLEHVQYSRAVIRDLKGRVLLLLAEGKQDEALQTCVLMFRLTRHFDHDPMLVSYLVAIACHEVTLRAADLVLRAGPLSASARNSLEAELALYDDVKGYQRALITERAYGLECFEDLPAQVGTLRISWLSPASFKNDECSYIDLMSQQIGLAARPNSEKSHAMTSAFLSAGPLTQLLSPAINAVNEATERTTAQVRCLRVLNALGRRAESADAGPSDLSDLGLPAEATTDPYTGTPLQVRKLPGGWLVYSLGKDLQDDGGRLADLTDVGFGPPQASNLNTDAEPDSAD